MSESASKSVSEWVSQWRLSESVATPLPLVCRTLGTCSQCRGLPRCLAVSVCVCICMRACVCVCKRDRETERETERERERDRERERQRERVGEMRGTQIAAMPSNRSMGE